MKNVKIGNRVAICGNRGTIKEITKDYDGTIYARITFDETESVSNWGQYQNRYFKITDFEII